MGGSYILAQSKSISSPFALMSSKPWYWPETWSICTYITKHLLWEHSMETMVLCPDGVTLCDRLLTDMWHGCVLAPTVGYTGILHWMSHLFGVFIPDSEDNDLEVTVEGIEEHAPSLPLSLHQPPHWMDCLPVQHALLHRLHGPGNRHVCTNSLSHTLITPSAPVELLSTSRMGTVRAEEKVLSGSWLIDEFQREVSTPCTVRGHYGTSARSNTTNKDNLRWAVVVTAGLIKEGQCDLGLEGWVGIGEGGDGEETFQLERGLACVEMSLKPVGCVRIEVTGWSQMLDRRRDVRHWKDVV